jgi:hypothetical protein
MLSVSVLFLDNIENFQSSWLTQGLRLGQVALRFGANDMGSIMIEENVVSAAGAHNRASEEMLRYLIKEAGFIPSSGTFFISLLIVNGKHVGATAGPRLKLSPTALLTAEISQLRQTIRFLFALRSLHQNRLPFGRAREQAGSFRRRRHFGKQHSRDPFRH